VCDIPVLYNVRVGARAGSRSDSVSDREGGVAIDEYNGMKLVVD
jgi:hypothetical protein